MLSRLTLLLRANAQFQKKSYHSAVVVFSLKDGMMAEFNAVMALPDGLPLTKQQPGLIEITATIGTDNKNDLVLLERWETPQAYQDYCKLRADTGFGDLLGKFLRKPLLTILSDKPTRPKKTE